MSDVEQPEPLFEEVAENQTIDEIPEPKKPPIKKKTKKVKEVKVEEEPLLPDIEDTVVEPTKIKKKRILTPEAKQRLLDNLARGRATSLAKRKKNAQLRKIAKEEQNQAEDDRIFQALKKKQRPKELEDENIRLREELAALKSSMSKPKEQKEASQKLIQVSESPKLIETHENKVVKKVEKPKSPPPAPVTKKVMSKREMMRMMRGL